VKAHKAVSVTVASAFGTRGARPRSRCRADSRHGWRGKGTGHVQLRIEDRAARFIFLLFVAQVVGNRVLTVSSPLAEGFARPSLRIVRPRPGRAPGHRRLQDRLACSRVVGRATGSPLGGRTRP